MPTTVKELVAAANAAVPRISPAEAKALHAKGEAVFIDLREPPELAASGTVPGALLGRFGRNGRNAGEFHWVHNMAVDSRGNVFTTEVDTGKRVQRFRLVSQLPR